MRHGRGSSPRDRRRTLFAVTLAAALVLAAAVFVAHRALAGTLEPAAQPRTPAAQAPAAYVTDQMVLVTGAKVGSTTGILRVMDLVGGVWVQRLSVAARFGRKGLIDGTKRAEGSNTTPTGIWLIPGYVFGTHAAPPAGTRLGYRRITSRSWWSSKAGSTYNTWVEASSWPGERLADSPSAYEFAVSTGYNALPNECVYGRGTAIFLHVQGSGLTAGCVAIPRSDMIRVCTLLDPAKRPVFVVGTTDDGQVTAVTEYLKSVNGVRAAITSLSPSPATTDTPVTFAGRATDSSGHAITAWQWRSSIDGVLGSAPTFSKTLTPGIHAIYLKAECSQGTWSPEVGTWLVVGDAGTKPLPLYRFYNNKTGTHFYTASEAERDSVQAHLASTYTLEGVAFAIDAASPQNDAPLYRFFNVRTGTHFYTASEAEKDTLIATLPKVYHYDGPVCDVSLTSAGAQPVYRFYDFKRDVHFYTASTSERDSIVAHLGYIYRYEGVAYYFVQPW